MRRKEFITTCKVLNAPWLIRPLLHVSENRFVNDIFRAPLRQSPLPPPSTSTQCKESDTNLLLFLFSELSPKPITTGCTTVCAHHQRQLSSLENQHKSLKNSSLCYLLPDLLMYNNKKFVVELLVSGAKIKCTGFIFLCTFLCTQSLLALIFWKN